MTSHDDPQSSFANIITFGGDTLHVTLNRKVQAGDTLTFHGFSGNQIHPATLTCCNGSTLTVLWTGTE